LPVPLVGERLGLAGAEPECLELADLVAQELAARAAVLDLACQPCPLRLAFPPFAGQRGNPRCQARGDAVAVDDLSLRIAGDQRLELLLAVDIDQQLAQHPHALGRQGLAVHVLARAPVTAYHPAQHEFAAVGFDRLLLEPAPHRRIGAKLERGRDFGPLGAVTQDFRARASAEGEHHRIDDDRLAGTRLAGQCRETRGQFEFRGIDHGEVADLQVRKHAQYSSPPERPLRPQCSFERSRRK